MDDIYDDLFFKKMLRRAQDYLMADAEDSLDAYAITSFSEGFPWSGDKPHCDSPLEAAFELWWVTIGKSKALDYVWGVRALELRRQEEIISCGRHYRLDFRVHPHKHDRLIGAQSVEGLDVPLPKIAVELDGHEFHEKTKEQVTIRNQRDRDLQADGWRIFHFSGSEFFRHPQQCVEEVYRTAQTAYLDFECQIVRARELAGNQS